MTPGYLQTLTAARSAPMPIDEPMTVSDLARLIAAERGGTAAGKGTVTFKAPEWTLAECALACGGMEDRHFWALRYSYALDDSVRSRLWATLFEWVLKRRETERWPKTVRTVSGQERKYVDELVLLVLIEERAPWRFARKPNDPDLRRTLMAVSEHTWRRNLSPVYEAVRTEYLCWLSIGKGCMRARLSESA
jgi:hypothetical protein